ncbi:MAG: methyltransferase domain-containing protein [Terrimonas sp.]|nr:methyltransferase domain-containing protein [Terrimonas sp.]
MGKIHHVVCPICGAGDVKNIFSVRDRTVSQENFRVVECNSCGLRYTQDAPDQASIGDYYKSEDYISHTDSSKTVINRLYKFVRHFTIRSKMKIVQRMTALKRGNLLDVGSGTGFFAGAMKKAGWQVTGLEPDQGARNVALASHQVKLEGMDELFRLPESSFDAITLWHVLEHVHELKRYVHQFRLLLREKGRILIAVPNYTAHDATVYQEYWAAYDVPRHLYHFSPESMKRLMDEQGMIIEKKIPMFVDSYYVSLLSSKYKKGKTNWWGALFTASVSNAKALFRPERCSSVIYVIRKR